MKIGKEITGIFPVEGDEDGATVEVKLLTPGEEEDIQEKMKLVKTIYRRNEAGEMVPEMEGSSEVGDKRYLRIIRAVKGWTGFEDAKGDPLPCTYENKLAAARESIPFRTTVINALKTLADANTAQKTEEVKNS
jgi:hypothetical protein